MSKVLKFVTSAGYYLLFLFSGVASAFILGTFSFLWEIVDSRKAGSFAGHISDMIDKEMPLVMLFSYLLVIAVIFFVFRVRKKSAAAYTGMSYFYPLGIFGAIVFGVLLNFVTFSLIPETEIIDGRIDGLYILCILTGPFVEELMFRGVLLKTFAASCGTIASVIITALLFAVSHTSPVQMLYAFTMGLVLAVVRIKSTSLWSAVALHTAFNISGIILATCDVEIPGVTYLVIPVLGALSFVLACSGGRKQIKRSKRV